MTVPKDYANPDWEKAGHVHEWKSYFSERVRAMWNLFTDEQKQALAESAADAADNENWD